MSRQRSGGAGYSSSSQEPKYVETDITPEQLGEFSGRTHDVTMIREVHASEGVNKMHINIMRGADPEFHVVEKPTSLTDELNESSASDKTGWGKVRFDWAYARDNEIPIVAADIEYENHENTSKLTVNISKNLHGNVGQLSAALQSAEKYIISNHPDEYDTDEVEGLLAQHTTTRGAVEAWIERFSDVLPDFHKEIINEALTDLEREDKSGPLNHINKRIDQIGDFVSGRLASHGRLKESDPSFSEKIDKALENFRKDHPDANATFVVGANHGEGIEKNLKDKGYEVGDIEVTTTNDPSRHGKVYVRHGGNDSNPDYIVAVYDPEALAPNFGKKYRFEDKEPDQQQSVSPTQIAKDNGEGQSQGQGQQPPPEIHTR